MKRQRACTVVAFAFAVWVSPQAVPAAPAPGAQAPKGTKVAKEEPAATVGPLVVSRKELHDRVASQDARHKLIMGGLAKVREMYLDQLIDEKLAALDARRGKLKETPEFRGLTETAVDSWLAAEYSRTVLLPASQPTPEQLKPFTPPRFERIKVRELAVDSEEEAVALRREILAGADFAALAEKHTISPGGAARGGELGWLTRGGRNIYTFEELEPLFALADGEVSPVIRTALGWEVFRVEGRADLTPEEIEEFMATPRANLTLENSGRILQELYAARKLRVDEKAVAALAADPALPGETVLGSVGGWDLTAVAFRAYLSGFRNPSQRPPSRTPEQVRQVAEGLLGNRAMRQVMEERGALEDPKKREVVDKFVAQTLATFYEDRILAKVAVTDDDVRKYFREHKAGYAPIEKVHLKIISVAERDRAEMIYQRLQEGKPWDTLAKAYSMDTSGAKGGDLGTVFLHDVAESYRDRVRGLPVGAYSQPIETASTWVLLSVVERDGPRPLTEAEAVKELREDALAEKKREVRAAHFARLRKSWPVTVNRAVVESVVPPRPALDFSPPGTPPPAGMPPGHPPPPKP